MTGRTVTWSSSSPATATVANGLVTAVDRGSATITATVDGRTASATLAVITPPASIALTRSASVLLPGDTMTVQVRVLDAQGREAPEAGQPTIGTTTNTITLAGGTVTAATPGAATVTATLGTLTATTSFTVAPGGGTRVAMLSSIDSLVVAELARLRIPSASVAIAQDGRLLLARAYGWADTTTREMASPERMYRVGSTSKPLTAMTVMRLVQNGQLSLDDKPFVMLPEVTTRPGFTEDPRLANITVRDLLRHSAGWGTNRAVDDSLWRAAVRDHLYDPYVIARYGRSVPLATNPGTAHAYQNFTYLMLGLLIEKVTGTPYAEYVRSTILAPAGVMGMVFARNPVEPKHPLEVTCYDNLPPASSPFGSGKACDVLPHQLYAHAAGAWVASATDMARWISVVDGRAGARPDVISAATITTMTARPSYTPTGGYYAMGWQVVNEGGGTTWSHAGGQTGGDGYVTRLSNGLVMVVLTNLTRGAGQGGGTLEPALNQEIRRITTWPTGTAF